ncbi:ABC transporter ATP-binding protein [Neobacillus sp. PS3-40]|uniref:ABC transporter ATP-binding protein n=1 Tax=Neobacillus sp. PS3-40 TaxID=3070679 RepID=UPI0027DF3453|nr:ABC transporter ATP-binding protein [Neobacillus sp. PS3-40]WML44268.1 ABC transporter ATP-binding protein [Neobacillus sp. PS3-40]
MIKFDNVSKRYPEGTNALNSLFLEINKGEFFIIIGPSGCGKSTLLKTINRLIDISDGTILINGKKISNYDIHELRWSIGYVLQQIALFPHMTIEENIAVVPELRKWDRKKIRHRVDELLAMVGLEPEKYRSRKPKELSGGQQQRIGVIRALAADPEIILMDEPFSALDPITREKLQDELLDLQKGIKKTIVFVTHDMEEALKLGDRICIMKDGEVVQTGTPLELLQNPANEFVKEFVGEQKVSFNKQMNLVKILNQTPPEKTPIMNNVEPFPITSSLKETLTFLAQHEQLLVEDDGEIIGTINRQVALQYLADSLQERGKGNE